MRRKDREMSAEFAILLIDRSHYAVLSTVNLEGYPYGVPLSVVRKDDALYFHSAKGGDKVDAFAANSKVCLTFVGEVNVPDLYTEGELTHLSEEKISALTSHVFTTEFESAMVFGHVSLVENMQEMVEALRLICEKYTPDKMKYFDLAIQSGMSSTNIYKVEIEKITAKRKKFDSNKEEMKWGRMES